MVVMEELPVVVEVVEVLQQVLPQVEMVVTGQEEK
jgi:hypothetical protein